MKVLLSKLGLDGHDRGMGIVAMALRDAGMEVIYLGRRNPMEQIVEAAVQEDVDVVGLSSLSDAHMELAPRLAKALKEEKGRKDVSIILGGFIHPEDIPYLKANGIDEVFGPGSRLADIVAFIKNAKKRK